MIKIRITSIKNELNPMTEDIQSIYLDNTSDKIDPINLLGKVIVGFDNTSYPYIVLTLAEDISEVNLLENNKSE